MGKKYLFFLILLIICISLFSNIIQKISSNTLITQDQLTAHTAKAIVITCMDFRLIDDVVRYLDSKGYNNNYDEFILAGASLGYNQTTYSAWTETLDKHIELAEKLHHIKEVIVIDHMNCGAYKIFYDRKSISESDEIALHKDNFIKFKATIKQKYPQLGVKTLLMKLNGEVLEL
jgi:carbonic anhydrase